MKRHIEVFQACTKNIEKFVAINIILKDESALISPAGYMIKGTGVFYANRSCHSACIYTPFSVNSQRPVAQIPYAE